MVKRAKSIIVDAKAIPFFLNKALPFSDVKILLYPTAIIVA